MAGIGGNNPLPAVIGGGKSEFERARDMLVSAVGEGGSAKNPNTVEQAWRRAKAMGLSSLVRHEQSAISQGFPDLATYALPEWERILQLPEAENEELRRREVVRKYTRNSRARIPDLERELQAIDPRFQLATPLDEHARVVVDGCYFQPRDGSFLFGNRKATFFPMFSDRFVHVILLPLGDGVAPGGYDQVVIARAREKLHEMLPAWESFRIVTQVGFTLDQSLLDVTAFGS